MPWYVVALSVFFALNGMVDVVRQPHAAFRGSGHSQLRWFLIQVVGLIPPLGIATLLIYTFGPRPSIVRAGGTYRFSDGATSGPVPRNTSSGGDNKPRMASCTGCNGSGKTPCYGCNHGWVMGDKNQQVPHIACGGSGGLRCGRCGGSGKQSAY
jgi:hypothetical protein